MSRQTLRIPVEEFECILKNRMSKEFLLVEITELFLNDWLWTRRAIVKRIGHGTYFKIDWSVPMSSYNNACLEYLFYDLVQVYREEEITIVYR